MAATGHRVAQIIAADVTMSFLVAQATKLLRFQQCISAVLPPPLAQHLRVANVHKGTLVLNADSPTWATKARYFAPEILRLLKNQDLPSEISDVTIRISLADSDPTGITAVAHQRSRTGAEVLTQSAEGMPTAALRDALIQLAHHVRGEQD